MSRLDLVLETKTLIRGLWRRKALTAMVVLPLALGLGATVAVFTVVEQVLLASLEFPAPERLVALRHSSEEGASLRLSAANYLDLERSESGAFEAVASYQQLSTTLVGQGDPTTLDAVRVTPSFFDVIGITPRIGRGFDPSNAVVPLAAETIIDHGDAVILGHELWRTRFGSRDSIIGRTITIDDRNLEVVGVMPQGFDFPQGSEIYLPLGFGDIAPLDRGGFYLEGLGRLSSGVSLTQAEQRTASLADQWAELLPPTLGKISLAVVPLQDFLVADLKTSLWLLFAVSALILLLVAANSAQLFLAYGLERQRDVAVRLALGGGRSSVLRQFLIESIFLACLATVIGLLAARWGLAAILSIAPPELLAGRAVELGWDSVLFAVVVGLVAGVVVGTAPALLLSGSRRLSSRLAEGGRAKTAGKAHKRFQDAMVVAQLALAVILIHATYLMVQSYQELCAVPLGFDPTGVAALDLTLPYERYPDEASMNLFVDRVTEELQGLPQVSRAGIGLRLPVVDSPGGVWIHSDPAQRDESHPVTFHSVSEGFLATLGVEVVQGRGLQRTDHATSEPVLVVNRRLAEEFFGQGSAVGRSIVLTPWADREFRIVGVAEDLPQGGLETEIQPAVFVPFAQTPMDRLRLIAKVDGDPSTALDAMRSAVWSVDPRLGVRNGSTLQSRLDAELLPKRFSTTLLGLYGLFGALLVASGIFGITSYFVESRRSEIGLRLALGGEPAGVVAWVLRMGVGRALLGCGLGVAGAAALAYFASDQLFGVNPWDPIAVVASILSLLLVVGAAHYLPARRAAATNPALVLRPE